MSSGADHHFDGWAIALGLHQLSVFSDYMYNMCMLELMHIKGVVLSCLYSNVTAFNVQIYLIRSCALKPHYLRDTCRVGQWQEARVFNKREVTTEKEEEDAIQSPDHLLSSCLGGQCGRTTHSFTLTP